MLLGETGLLNGTVLTPLVFVQQIWINARIKNWLWHIYLQRSNTRNAKCFISLRLCLWDIIHTKRKLMIKAISIDVCGTICVLSAILGVSFTLFLFSFVFFSVSFQFFGRKCLVYVCLLRILFSVTSTLLKVRRSNAVDSDFLFTY